MNSAPSPAAPPRCRPLLGGLLVLAAVVAVVFGIAKELRSVELARSKAPAVAGSAAPGDPARTDAPSTAPEITTVYYFHGDTRCPTCLAIESQAAETVQSMFAADIEAGRLRFSPVNYDTPEHRHFRADYDLAFGSVVVVGDGRWENLSDVWTLVHGDRAAFDDYLVRHISAYVKDVP